MDSCGVHCLPERRIVKKELNTWSKKLPFLIGLEEVTRSVIGKKLSRKLLDPIPYLNTHNIEPSDWKTDESCNLCLHKRTQKKKEDSSSSQPKPEAYQKQALLNRNAQGSNPRLSHTVPLLTANSHHVTSSTHVTMVDPDEPLDLSLSGCKAEEEEQYGAQGKESSREQSPLKVPNLDDKLNSKKRDGWGKRPYTEADLNHAVNDVRTGKLGTRRAALLYGIPRSTLRNNMCRVNASSDKASPTPMLSIKSEAAHQDSSPEQLSPPQALDPKTLSHIRHKHDLLAGIERPFGWPPLFYNDKYIRECQRAFQEANPYAYDLKLPFLHELIMRYTHDRVNGDGPVNLSFDDYKDSGIKEKAAKFSTTDRHAHLSPNHDSQVDLHNDLDLGDPQGPLAPAPTSQLKDVLSNGISKTLHEKLYDTTYTPSAQISPASVEDIPTQPVFPQPCDTFYLPPHHQNGASYLAVSPSFITDYKPESKRMRLSSSPPKKQKVSTTAAANEASNSSKAVATTDEDGKPLKKTRPKRGQYRKYNHELLVEAVKAVQRGEMSVHRAGSYYGVPHSTLEYKVKERHLLRQKKPREPRGKKAVGEPTADSTAKLSPTPVPTSPSSTSKPSPSKVPEASQFSPLDSTKSDVTDNGSSLQAAEALRNSLLFSGMGGLGPLSGYPLPPAMHLGLGWPGLLGTTPPALPDPSLLSLFAAGMGGGHASASDLLKKLQAKVQADIQGEAKAEGSIETESLRNEDTEREEEASEFPKPPYSAAAPLVEVSDK